eukprot:5143577-Pyramimonas_sp.AAC.1
MGPRVPRETQRSCPPCPLRNRMVGQRVPSVGKRQDGPPVRPAARLPSRRPSAGHSEVSFGSCCPLAEVPEERGPVLSRSPRLARWAFEAACQNGPCEPSWRRKKARAQPDADPRSENDFEPAECDDTELLEDIPRKRSRSLQGSRPFSWKEWFLTDIEKGGDPPTSLESPRRAGRRRLPSLPRASGRTQAVLFSGIWEAGPRALGVAKSIQEHPP